MIKKVNSNSIKVPRSVKLGFGFTGLADMLMYTAFYTFAMFYFTDVVGFTPIFAGTLVMVGTIWDGITDPLIGIFSDNLRSKYGRRRPILLGVAVPFAIISWLLFTNPGFGETGTKIYYLVIVIAFYTVQTLLDVPYTALGTEMALDYDERSSINKYRGVFAEVGGVVSGFVLAGAFYLAELTGSVNFGWSIIGAIIGIVSLISILVGWRATKGFEIYPEKTESNYKDIFKDALRNRSFRYCIGLFCFGIMSQAFMDSFFVYYLKYAIELTEGQISMVYAILWGSGILWAFVIEIFATKWSKKVSYVISLSMWVIGLTVGVLFILQPGMLYGVYVMVAFLGIGTLAVYQLAWTIIPDCIEVDEFKSGQRREGLYYGLVNLIQKISTAIAMGLCGILLGKIGYLADSVQTPETIHNLKLILGLGVGITLIISMVFCVLNPMNRKKHSALREAIELKKQGKEFDITPFQDLL